MTHIRTQSVPQCQCNALTNFSVWNLNRAHWPTLFLLHFLALQIAGIHHQALNFHKVHAHTNILINSNFETFNGAHTARMYAQIDRWVLCFYSRKNMSTLSSHHNALHAYMHVHSFTIVNHQTHTHIYTTIMDTKSLNCSLVWTMNVCAFRHSENCHFIEWNEYEQALHMLLSFSPFIGPIRTVACLHFISFAFEAAMMPSQSFRLLHSMLFMCVIWMKRIVCNETNFISIHTGYEMHREESWSYTFSLKVK